MDALMSLSHRVLALETAGDGKDDLAKLEEKLDQVLENQQNHQDLLEDVVERLADLELPYQTPFND